jgi:hypothetical protein
MTLYIDTKPELEWVLLKYTGDESAYVPLFALEYLVGEGDGFFLRISDSISNDKWDYYDTLSEAKAAAQADYDRRTAERFRPVELPPFRNMNSSEFLSGWDSCLAYIEATAKATEAKP